MNTHNRALVLCSLVWLGAVFDAISQPAPANDSFTNRTILSGSSLTFTGSFVGATTEPFETNDLFFFRGFGGSVWWTWTALESTAVVIELLRDYNSLDSSNSVLSVHAGTDPNALVLIDYNNFDAPQGRYVVFAATAGTSYQFRAMGRLNQPFSFRLTATNPPVFLRQPQDQAVSPFGTAFFCAMAGGLRSGSPISPATRYQWKFNGINLQGETAPSLMINQASPNQVGTYSVVASNSGGLSESIGANLTILETNPVPRLTASIPSEPARLSFALTGEGGRWYKIESSVSLTNWTNPLWIQSTNETSLLAIPRLGPTHFVRASLNVPSDVCSGYLKQIFWAQNIVAIEDRLTVKSTLNLGQLFPFVKVTDLYDMLPCPEGGYYIAQNTVLIPITCSLKNRGHVLPSLP